MHVGSHMIKGAPVIPGTAPCCIQERRGAESMLQDEYVLVFFSYPFTLAACQTPSHGPVMHEQTPNTKQHLSLTAVKCSSAIGNRQQMIEVRGRGVSSNK